MNFAVNQFVLYSHNGYHQPLVIDAIHEGPFPIKCGGMRYTPDSLVAFAPVEFIFNQLVRDCTEVFVDYTFRNIRYLTHERLFSKYVVPAMRNRRNGITRIHALLYSASFVKDIKTNGTLKCNPAVSHLIEGLK